MRRVAIVGVGHTKFGKRSDASLRELAFEAVKSAIEDTQISLNEVEASIVGIASDELADQLLPATPVADYVGMNPKPNIRVEAACATGGAALRTGWMAVASGLHDLVLVCGVEKMTEVPTARAIEIMGMGGDVQWEFKPFGTTFPGYYAMYADAHMRRYGTTERQLALVSVKNHRNATKNPYAHFPKEISVEDVLKSKPIAYPLKLYDCCPISDGAAAVLLASGERAKRITDTPVYIAGLGCASDSMAVFDRSDFTSIKSAILASKQAYKMAKIEVGDIDLAEVHDCFSIAEIMAYEDLGFCEKGKGGKFIEEGQSEMGGKIPVNVDGGLLAKGHPLGATGISQAVEITKQLRGEGGLRQVAGAEVALSHNVGGTGHFVYVHVYRR